MTKMHHRSFAVTDRSHGAAITQNARQLSDELAFSSKKKGELDIIVAELVSNLVKYGNDGELLIRPIQDAQQTGIELISVDSGPGMADPSQMLKDGVSTGDSLGQGLGAVKRLSDEFQLYSQSGMGTVVLARLYQRSSPQKQTGQLADVRWICVPKTGETVCGDACYYQLTTSSLKLFLGDGLGHGLAAEIAVSQAINQLTQSREITPEKLLALIHKGTTGTRGLVGTCAVFDFSTRKWLVCGVGNITTKLSTSSGVKGYVPQNGILGYVIPSTLLPYEMPYERGQWLVMTSDGLRTRWNPARYPDINQYDASILAAVIYKECARHTDDMSVLVGKLY
jgi:anti-sigma regulatory factor (Ser/Thr protein kinase)